MGSKITITCFTDLKGSTQMTEELGHEGMRPLRDEYLRVGEILASNTGGRHVKNIGDAHMVEFHQIEDAFRFSAQLQQFYDPQPNYEKAPLVSRIGLGLGVNESYQKDIFGSGVNKASRVESWAEPNTVWLNEELMAAARTVWGSHKTEKYISFVSQEKLKGFDGEHSLYSFDWKEYIKEMPEESLSNLVLKHLDDASVIASNLQLEDISNHSPIIWPVVPRDGVNAIHCGQLEIIRLLSMVGSEVHVLIADCGATNNPTREYSESFIAAVDKHALKRGMKDIKYSFMSDLFKPRCEGCDKFHKHFQSVISQLSLEHLLDINNKEYADDVKKAIKQAPTLDFLHPALTISAVIHLSMTMNKKCIIVVGQDEEIQWESAHQAIPSTRDQFGVLFNPKLMRKGGTQGRQTNNWPLYFSWPKIVQDMEEYDLAKWFTQLHLFLSSFPESIVKIGEVELSPIDWKNTDEFEKKIDRTALAQQVFNVFINPK